MTKRPTSVTVVARLVIFFGCLGAIANTALIAFSSSSFVRDAMSKGPVPTPLDYAIGYVGSLISIVCGIAMLKGRNWARLLFVVSSALRITLNLATSPMRTKMVPALLIFAVVAYYLFRPKANEYFSPSEPSKDANRD